MADQPLPKRGKKRESETMALKRIVDKQLRRVSESPDASPERRAVADEIRRITDSVRRDDADSEA
jgi:hypothetical protein